MTTTKRGGRREGSGAKPHPPEQVASVRIVANVTPAEAQEWARRGRTAWLRAELRKLCSWQQIDSAPRDVVILLGYAPHRRMDGTRRVYEGRWNDGQKRFTGVNGFFIHDSATHWMPLPEPPSACKLQVQDSQ